MGCLGVLLVRLAYSLFQLGEITPAIWGSVAVGGVVGLIVGLAKVNWILVFAGCGVGFVVGLVLELVIRRASRHRRQ
jgi:xanthosine utilization system XapX-like protein